MVLPKTYKGMELEELTKLKNEDLAKILPSRSRRVIKRGFTPRQLKLIRDINSIKDAESQKKPIKTQEREMVILPQMVGKRISVHNGRDFVEIVPNISMIGRRLGEYALTRKIPVHTKAGVGASRSSKHAEEKK